ncbi:hypothetical protein DY000_02041881 [Brassica cretica]|uniref:Uncharacterized protein n=1 Tax=Brassica cretica TaxID=69181 RepID=A0ABQ7BEX3_BRACR|nr:hypothetical protein DY000_02041881 [Brassica cretica]
MLDDDEKMVRNGDRPFTKAKRSNCDMLDRNELQTYASLEKMLHKAIFAMLFRNSKRRQTPTLLLHQNSNFEKDSKNVLNKNEFSGPLNALDIGAYDLGLGSFVVPIRLTEPCTGSTRVRPEWSFGWNHDQTTELTIPELLFHDHLDILRTIVEPELALVVKNPKTDMHSHPDHSDSPACVLLPTAVHPSGLVEHGQ